MAAYTYDDFVNKATGAGLLGNFSSYDLDLAKKYPEFGLSILSLKQDYNRASTDEARALANQAANQLRSSYGSYTGGRDGSLYIADGLSPGSYQSEYKNKIDEVLGQMGAFGDFSYTPAPAYTNQYKDTIDSLLDQIVNREDFSYNKDEDPNWSAYKKQYRREGDRATASALAQASAASGGLPSSYAVNAATQAGDYYAAQLSDMLLTLYQQAYDRYLNEYQMKQSDLAAVSGQEQNDYQKYLTDLSQWNTDRDFAYTDYINRFNRLQSQLGAYQTQDETEYGRLLDQVNYNTQKSQAEYEKALAQQQLAQSQIDAILAAGGTPGGSLLLASGYSPEYAQTLENYYRQQALAAAGSGTSGGSRSGTGSGADGGNAQDYEGLFAAAYASGNAQNFISSNYKKYGFTSSSGLYSGEGGYKDWLASDAFGGQKINDFKSVVSYSKKLYDGIKNNMGKNEQQAQEHLYDRLRIQGFTNAIIDQIFAALGL